MSDKQFINIFSIIIGALIGITALILIAATSLSSIHAEMDLAMRHSMEEHLSPIGKVHIGSVVMTGQDVKRSEPADSLQNVTNPSADQTMDGRSVYNTVCSACHLAGVANAPIFGNKATWAPRISQGIETLYTSSLNGKGAMPAKGGRTDLPDNLIKSAVDYMVEAVR